MSKVTSGFMVDGKFFATKAEALAYQRRPLVMAALKPLVEGNDALASWLFDNAEDVAGAFEANKVKRVSKAEKNALLKALDALKELNEPKCAFLVANASAIAESFRWPAVKRVSEEEGEAVIKAALTVLTENEELSSWIVQNKDRLLAAFAAGTEKREVSSSATNALAIYQGGKTRERLVAFVAEARKLDSAELAAMLPPIEEALAVIEQLQLAMPEEPTAEDKAAVAGDFKAATEAAKAAAIAPMAYPTIYIGPTMYITVN